MVYEMTIFRFIADLDLLLDCQRWKYLNIHRYSTLKIKDTKTVQKTSI